MDSLREFLKKKVETRKQTSVPPSDLTDIFLSQMKTSSEISDLQIFLLLQSVPTLESTFKSFISIMITQADARKNLRAELDPFMSTVKDDIVGKLTLDSVDKAEYLKMAIYEVLRKDPPIAITGAMTVSDKCEVSGLTLYPTDTFFIAIKHTHHDPKEWKEPEQFIPSRFDKNSHFFLGPGGEKRNPFAFNPFFGGQRACVGRTLAESILKLVLPIVYHHFNF